MLFARNDLFARVEALPWGVVRNAAEEHKTWSDPESYVAAIGARPLGVNVGAFIGHSDIRVATMGLGRAVDADERPTEGELDQMSRMLEAALDAGFVGLSTIRSSFSKLDGRRYPARQLPSTYATWREYRRLNSVLRRRNRVHQSTPNLTGPAEVVLYIAQSSSRLLGRRPKKTALLAAADVKGNRAAARATTTSARLANAIGGADVRWQHLPVPFEVYADGIDLVIFEEFGSGAAALNVRDVMERGKLLDDEEYRRWFRKDVAKRFGPRVWHRDLYDAEIMACPDPEVVGKSFGQVADERGIEPADALLDLAVAHGSALRWRTTIANDRDDVLDRLQQSPAAQIGFADSGAHLAPGHSADIAVIDPAGFDGSSGEYKEAPMPGTQLSRMVNRNDRAVAATIVGGQIVYEYGTFADGFGTTLHAGTFLAARDGTDQKRRTGRLVDTRL
jgi:N-acyl-D-aspartate/D-glutamate deacylase